MYITSGVCCWHSPDLISTWIPLLPVSSTATLGLFLLITQSPDLNLLFLCVFVALRRKPVQYERVLSGKPQGPRLYYSNDYLGSVGVHLSAPVRHWLESLLGFIGLEAQTLTEELCSSRVKMEELEQKMTEQDWVIAQLVGDNLDCHRYDILVRQSEWT